MLGFGFERRFPEISLGDNFHSKPCLLLSDLKIDCIIVFIGTSLARNNWPLFARSAQRKGSGLAIVVLCIGVEQQPKIISL